MASVAQHLSDWRFDTSIDTNQITDNQALNIFNRARRDIINEIRKAGDNYFYNYYKVENTVVWQEEYTLRQKTNSDAWMVKVQSVSIKYNTTDTSSTKVRYESIYNLDRDLEWYKTNWSQQDPFYLVMDKSIFIYPAPDENVDDWLTIYAITDPVDCTLSWTEAEVAIPIEWQGIIPILMKKYSYQSRGMINEKNDAIAEYEREIAKLKKGIKRNLWPLQINTWNLYYLHS